jgi:hypothetical protein
MLKERAGETCLKGLSWGPARIMGKDWCGIRGMMDGSQSEKCSIEMSAGADLHNADLKIR